jgi:hypothetical protein
MGNVETKKLPPWTINSPIREPDDDASRYCGGYRWKTFYEGALSALGTRINAVHPVARSLDALRNETAFTTNSKKSISLATRLPNSSNMNGMYLHTLVQNFLATNLGVSHNRSKLRKCVCGESVRLSEGGSPKHGAIEARVGVKSAH